MTTDIPQNSPVPEGQQVSPEGTVNIDKPSNADLFLEQAAYKALSEDVKTYIGNLRKENEQRRLMSEQLQTQVNDLTTRMTGVELQREKQLAAEGNFQQIAVERAAKIAELEPLASEVERYKQRIVDSNAKRIAALPPARQAMVKALSLPPDQLASWLDDYADQLAPPQPPPVEGGGRGVVPQQAPSAATPADKAIAELLPHFGVKNVTAEGIAGRRKSPTPVMKPDEE